MSKRCIPLHRLAKDFNIQEARIRNVPNKEGLPDLCICIEEDLMKRASENPHTRIILVKSYFTYKKTDSNHNKMLHFDRDIESHNKVAKNFSKAINLRAEKLKVDIYKSTLSIKLRITKAVLNSTLRKRVEGKSNKNVTELTAPAILSLEKAGFHRDEILGPIDPNSMNLKSEIENNVTLRGLYKLMVDSDEGDIKQTLDKFLKVAGKFSSLKAGGILKTSNLTDEEKRELREFENNKMKNTMSMCKEIREVLDRYNKM